MNILELTRNVLIHTNRTVIFIFIKPIEYYEKNEQKNLFTIMSLLTITALIILNKGLGVSLFKLLISINIDPHSNLYVSWMATCVFIGVLLPTLNMWFNINPSDISNKVATKNEKSNSKELLNSIKIYYNLHFYNQTTNNDYSIKSYDYTENKTFNSISNQTTIIPFNKKIIISKTVDFMLKNKFFNKKNKPSEINLKRLLNLDFKNISEKIILNTDARQFFLILYNLNKLNLITNQEIAKIIENEKLNTHTAKGLNKSSYSTSKRIFKKEEFTETHEKTNAFFKELEYETRFKKQ